MPTPPEPYPSRDEAFAAFAAHVSPGKAAFFREVGLDVVMGRREGARFFDAHTDRPLFNCHSNGGVFNLGHRHPAIVSAVRDALETLDIGNHHLVSGRRAALAARLSATTGGALPGVVFGVAGGEAIDVAIKDARAATGRRGIVSAVGGYHGHTGLALLAGDARYREPFGLESEDFRQVPFDDLGALERRSTDRPRRSCSRASPPRWGCQSRRPATSPAPSSSRERAAPSWWSTRCRPGSGAAARCGATSTRASRRRGGGARGGASLRRGRR
jgi:4-aminobutyrate aminotransferase-like enzyme